MADTRVATENTLTSTLHSVKVIEAAITGVFDDIDDLDEVEAIVRSNDAWKEVLPIGSQINTAYTHTNGTVYEDPFDIIDHAQVTAYGEAEARNGLMLQQHYANIDSCPFDPMEALYDADDGLEAGTYYFLVVKHPWVSADNNKYYQFTLTQAVPAGGQIAFGSQNDYQKDMTANTIKTYASADSMTVIEEVSITECTETTDTTDSHYLGQTDGQGLVNDLYPAYRGNGRWATSMLRQWLNAEGTDWWVKQDKWDRIGSFASTRGYMSGFSDDFKAHIHRVKVCTARNTRWLDGGTDETYDYFFPLSKQQYNFAPQIADIEGSAAELYQKVIAGEYDSSLLDASGRFKDYPQTYPLLIKYALNAKTSARICWLRSAVRGSASAWIVTSTGYAGGNYAIGGSSCAPACVIC